MKQTFLMTAFGKDRPGIVADVTELIYETGCNLEDTSMARLADEFTLVLLFTGEGEHLEARLNRECRRLEIEKGLSAFVRRVETDWVEPIGETLQRIRVDGLDQTGIVYKIGTFLANEGINIEQLSSKRSFSAQSGAALYHMEMKVLTPKDRPLSDYAEGFDRLANELNVDISLM